jgi:hypothetical protein
MYSPGDIALADAHRRHTEQDGQVGHSTPLIPSKTRLVVSWIITLAIFTLIGFIAIAVILA